ncbi:C-type lectin domain family 3 member A isoform X2 [Chroicocephalus ridibundus]|uniref:C-type lectin domain family 3 member A isoform X2 n=1 Tax=Chroicocephalus ridibundus TaxID=1192867 RepID=UPI002FDE1F48
MAQTGLTIFLLISILLLDQTISQASKFKARKHSKRRVKEKDDLKTQIDKLWREVNALKEMQALQTGVYSRPLLPSSAQKEHSFEEHSLLSVFVGQRPIRSATSHQKAPNIFMKPMKTA